MSRKVPLEGGTQVWIRTDDGIFWPAVVCHPEEFEAEMLPYMLTDTGRVPDTCARFYHDRDSVFPIDSSDTSTVKRAYWDDEAINNPDLQAAAIEHQTLTRQRGVGRVVEMVKSRLAREGQATPKPSGVAVRENHTHHVHSTSRAVAFPQHHGGHTAPSGGGASPSVPSVPPSVPSRSASGNQPNEKEVANHLGLEGEQLRRARALFSALNPHDASLLTSALSRSSSAATSEGPTEKSKRGRPKKKSQTEDNENETIADMYLRERGVEAPVAPPRKVPLKVPIKLPMKVMPAPSALAAVSTPLPSAANHGLSNASAALSAPPRLASSNESAPSAANSTSNNHLSGGTSHRSVAVGPRPKFAHVDGWDDSRLHHLRYTLFDVNLPHSKDSLDPSWLFHTMIGAVTIADAAKATTVEFEGIDKDLGYSFGSRAGTSMGRGGRRILLVAMGTDFSCSHGWMEPIPITETVLLTMRVELAGADTDPDYDAGHGSAVPKNWRLPSSQQNAIKSFIPLDVTDAFQEAVQNCGPNKQTLSVRLNVYVENQAHARDIALWGGVLALIAAAPVSNEQICKWITTRPQPTAPIAQSLAARSGSLRRSLSDRAPKRAREEEEDEIGDLGMTVTVQCPISLQLMEVPSRGIRCTHQQCCELAYIVEICVSTKVWACPFCKGPMPFREIMVDVPLVDYIGETSERYRERDPSALYRNGRYYKCPQRSGQLSTASSTRSLAAASASPSGGGHRLGSNSTLTQVDSFCVDDD